MYGGYVDDAWSWASTWWWGEQSETTTTTPAWLVDAQAREPGRPPTNPLVYFGAALVGTLVVGALLTGKRR